MLDTGADFCSLDPAAAEEIGTELTENGHIRGFAASRASQYTRAQILLPTAQQIFQTRLAIIDYRGLGQPWDLILGRDFLMEL